MLTVWVPGKPQAQGSKNGFIVNGKVVMVESAKGLKPWREKIKAHVLHAERFQKFDGAVAVSMSFHFTKPKSNKKKSHTQKPDVDKLTRAVFDSLTGTCLNDDSQVISLSAMKFWADENTAEGVLINVWEIEDER